MIAAATPWSITHLLFYTLVFCARPSHLETPNFGAIIAMDNHYIYLASLHGCNQLDQFRRYCRGEKTDHEETTAFNDALKGQA